VAKEAGILEASITSLTLQASAYVGLNEYSAPHAVDVIFGTSVMIPRDVLNGSMFNIQKEIEGILHDNLRDFVFHFRGPEEK
jgi:hypothetical protein